MKIHVAPMESLAAVRFLYPTVVEMGTAKVMRTAIIASWTVGHHKSQCVVTASARVARTVTVALPTAAHVYQLRIATATANVVTKRTQTAPIAGKTFTDKNSLSIGRSIG